ncbi:MULTISPECIES: tetratricopeptide repeat-containing glycosyltransferase family protein [Asaia]|uniref:tetratricopeptide repeat-containing glycosyltransferase family protein n=1 Tax=Asaia TaxID=91914 RepID=UPI00255673DA|nr:tetratricopeptide repeat-containing glycosyltransferase family protein [Asaia sp. HumB]MDL2170507.1 tetratricopeptide repeat-containing glycosyltransferase family protein [Asaia sp. HumB]
MTHPEGSAEALQLAGDYASAAKAYEIRLQASPDNARTLSNYGGLLNLQNRFSDALALLGRSIALDPGLPDAWSNIGNSFLHLSQYENAIACYRNSLRLEPSHALALSNMGVALDHRGDHALARGFHDAAVQMNQENIYSRTNRAVSLLQSGDYAEGFREYEHRWTGLRASGGQSSVPRWGGELAPDKTLMVFTEGGFGDVLQFSRLAPLAAQKVGQVILRVRPELVSLLERSFPEITVLSEDDILPEHDLECPVLSLPHVLGITLETIPVPGRYLRPDPIKITLWRERLRAGDADDWHDTFRVGLVWAGAPHPEVQAAFLADHRRSMNLQDLAPLGQVARRFRALRFYSLQIGERAAQAANPPEGMRLSDHTRHIASFDDTAALIDTLDLVIAVDTSTAHVSAGLGKPTWLLSRYDQCWRWLSGRCDSPWYESIRLYQQKQPLNWEGPVAMLTDDLTALLETRYAHTPVSAR